MLHLDRPRVWIGLAALLALTLAREGAFGAAGFDFRFGLELNGSPTYLEGGCSVVPELPGYEPIDDIEVELEAGEDRDMRIAVTTSF